MIVTGEAVARFVSEGLGFGLCPPYIAIGMERDGKITAGVLLNQFEGADVAFTAFGKGWTRGLLIAIGDYVFGQLGCLRATAETEQEDVARLACKLGGKVEGRKRDHFGDGRDAIIVGILRRDWKFANLLAIECG